MHLNLLSRLVAQACPKRAILSILSFVPLAAHAEYWSARAPAPGARAAHSAVWTGRELIVWGGGIDGQFLNTGGRYLPGTDTWRPTSTSGAPEPRWFHAAVWTGREMIIWGGRASFSGDQNYNDGGRYNPETDTWRRINLDGAPSARSQCAAVWTGREMIVWGGAGDGGNEVNDGARYDPETDAWYPISNSSGLEPRMEPSGIWTGNEFIVFGGMKFTGGQLSFGNGARYRPITDTWTPLPEAYAAPTRTGHTAVWTGERMLVWGGREVPQQTLLNNGAIFDPELNVWTPISGDPYLPGRMYHAAVWTGSEMIVWGGQDIGGTMLNSGARFRPATGRWTATTSEGAAGKRQFWRPDLGIWTGEAMLIAAGSDYPASLDSTWMYFPEGSPPTTTNCVPVPSGLVAWWRAEGNADDVTGTHAGQLLDGASFAPGRVGQAFSFDGLRSRVSIPDAEAFKLSESLTFEGWIRAASLAPGIIFFRGDNRPGLDPYAMALNTDGRLHWGINDANNQWAAVDSPGVLPTGVWLHVAGVLNGTTGDLDMFMNGVLVSHTTTTLRPFRDLDPASEPALGIGNHGGTFHNFPFHGLIDEWALYSRALSPAEILAIYQAGAVGKCTSPNPPPEPGQNLVFNGSFELGIDPGLGRQLDAPDTTTITGWAVTGGSVDYIGPGWTAGDGQRSLDMSGVNAGTLSQEVPGFVAGQSYRLSFLMAGNPDSIPPLPAVKRLQASVGSASAEYSFDATGFSDANLGWTLRTLDFTAAAPTLTLTFVSLTDGPGGAALDKVSIIALTNLPPTTTNCVPVPSGLVGWWRGEGNTTDSTGHGDGTANAGVSYEPGVVGQAFRIDGIMGRINVPDQEAFKLVDALSMEAWVKLINRDSGLSILMRGDDRPGLDPYFLGVDQGKITFGISDEVDSDYIATPLAMGQWKHVTGTFDAVDGSLKLYLDGVLMAQKQTTRKPARELDPQFSPGLAIGNVSGSWINFPWDGWLDEVSLYNRALSAQEIFALYQAGTAGKCPQTNGPPSGPVAFDLSNDFSPNINPAGAWSYGYLATLDGPFQLLTFPKSFSSENGVLISAWQVSDSQSPSVNRVLGDGVATSEGGAFTAPSGTVYVWPGNAGSPGSLGAIRFTVPPGGPSLSYRLDAAVQPTFDGPSSGDTDFHILRNGHELFGQFLGPNTGTTYSTTLGLAAGETIDFVVGAGADGAIEHSSLKIQVALRLLTNAPPPPPSTNCVPAPASLVAWWPGEGNAHDALGRHPGTLVGNVTYAPGMVGQGFHFDGSGGYVRIPNDDALDFPSELTIELWYQHEGLPGENYGLVSTRGTEVGPVNYAISVIPIGIGPYFNDPIVAAGDDAQEGGTFEASRYLPVPSSGVFHHLGVTFRQTPDNQVELRTFIDGALVRTKRLPARLANGVSDAAIVIGRSAEYGEEIFHGVIDEVTLYRRALREEEMRAIAAARGAGKCLTTSAQAIAQLRDLLNSAPASVNTDPLRAKLEDVAASLFRGNVRAAIHQLRAFQRRVRRWAAPVAPALAQQLLQAAQQLIESLDPRGERREELAAMEALPIQIQRVVRTDQGMRVEVSAPPGSLCRIYRSTNLREWIDAGPSIEASDGMHQYLDVQMEETGCFYRLSVLAEDEKN